MSDIYTPGVMGDFDAAAFNFNETFSDHELIELYVRNPRVAFLCDWPPAESVKNGIKWSSEKTMLPMDKKGGPSVTYIDKKGQTESVPQSEFLELIKAWPKIQQMEAYCRLLGDALIVMLGTSSDLTKPEEKYTDFAVYHRLDGNDNGYVIKELYTKEDAPNIQMVGQPKSFEIKIRAFLQGTGSTGNQGTHRYLVTEERCIFAKNPVKRLNYTGTPDSRKIAHVAQLEELILRCIGKRALDLAGNVWHFKNVKDATHAAEIEDKVKGILQRLYSKGLEIEILSPKIMGNSDEYVKLFEVLKQYMAFAMFVDQNALSNGSDNGLIMNYAVVKQVQTHFKPYLEQIFRMLGFSDPNFEYEDPVSMINNPNLPIQNRDEYNGVGKREQSVKSDSKSDGKKPASKDGKQ
jgi:hypothetical protein